MWCIIVTVIVGARIRGLVRGSGLGLGQSDCQSYGQMFGEISDHGYGHDCTMWRRLGSCARQSCTQPAGCVRGRAVPNLQGVMKTHSAARRCLPGVMAECRLGLRLGLGLGLGLKATQPLTHTVTLTLIVPSSQTLTLTLTFTIIEPWP